MLVSSLAHGTATRGDPAIVLLLSGMRCGRGCLCLGVLVLGVHILVKGGVLRVRVREIGCVGVLVLRILLHIAPVGRPRILMLVREDVLRGQHFGGWGFRSLSASLIRLR